MEQSRTASVRNYFLLSLFSLLSSLTLLSGCASTPVPIVVDIPRAPINLPAVDVLKLDSVEWLIITEANYKEVFAELRKRGLNPVLFGLSETGYKNLAINVAKIRAMIEQQQSVMEAYKQYYDEETADAKTEAKRKQAQQDRAEAAKPWWKKSDPAPKPVPVPEPRLVPAPAKPVDLTPVLPPSSPATVVTTPAPVKVATPKPVATKPATTKPAPAEAATIEVPPVKPVKVN